MCTPQVQAGHRTCQAVTRAIITLAKQLDLEVVAEGVETQAQCEFLIAEGCDYLQAYLFSRPVSVDLLASATAPGFTATAK